MTECLNCKATAILLKDTIEALEGMVYQHTHDGEPEDGEWDTGALSANADAVHVLEALGRVKVLREAGRMVVFTWVKKEGG